MHLMETRSTSLDVSTTVIELFFNFAAVQFVSELDNIAFQLACKGYMVMGDLELTNNKKTY
eukprot:scaffold243918_cov59-Attheya_sp.AAC.3